MAILRDTRSRIDPALLAAMKEKLSAHAHPRAATEPPPLKEGLFKRDYKDTSAENPPRPAPASGDVEKAEPVADENGMVPVDRQKVAQIVLQYMKNREEKQKH